MLTRFFLNLLCVSLDAGLVNFFIFISSEAIKK